MAYPKLKPWGRSFLTAFPLELFWRSAANHLAPIEMCMEATTLHAYFDRHEMRVETASTTVQSRQTVGDLERLGAPSKSEP